MKWKPLLKTAGQISTAKELAMNADEMRKALFQHIMNNIFLLDLKAMSKLNKGLVLKNLHGV